MSEDSLRYRMGGYYCFSFPKEKQGVMILYPDKELRLIVTRKSNGPPLTRILSDFVNGDDEIAIVNFKFYHEKVELVF